MPGTLRSRLSTLLLALTLTGALFVPRPAHAAISKEVRTMFVTSAYGVLAGTAVGLLTLPLHQDIKGVFVGSSVGLYLGAVVGVYHLLSKDDPQNPLRSEAAPRDPDAPVDLALAEPRGESVFAPPSPDFELRVPVLRF